MKTNKKIIIMLITVLVMTFNLIFAESLIEHQAVVSGNVTYVVNVGDNVEEGQSLVEVASLVGSVSTSRAVVKGVVTKVLVSVNDEVQEKEVVVIIRQK